MNAGKEVIGARTKGWGSGGGWWHWEGVGELVRQRKFLEWLWIQSVKNRTNSELIQGIWENDSPI